MIFKFKNGYQVQIRDCGNKTREELIEIAKKAVEDAVKLEKNIDTNTSFMITKIKEGVKNSDDKVLNREWDYLTRDIMADYTDTHMKNYPKIYRQEILDKIIKQYRDALDQFDKVDGGFDVDLYRNYVDDIANAWSVGASENQKTREVASIIKFENGGVLKKNHSDVAGAVNHVIHNFEKITKKYGPVGEWYVMDLTTGEILADDKNYRITDSEKPVWPFTWRQLEEKLRKAGNNQADVAIGRMMDIVEEETGERPDYGDIAPARVVRNVLRESKTVKDAAGDMNDPEVIGYIEYVDIPAKEKRFSNIKQAREELQKLLHYAKQVGEPVARALILNADTEDVIEEVYKDKELFTDSEDMNDANDIPPYRVKITYANGEVTIKYVEDLTAAVRDIRRRIDVGKKDGNAVVVALVFDSMTDEIILSSDRDEDIRVKDAPPPYYDPTDYPTIKSDYSPDRLKREIRHMEKSQPIIDEFDEVIAEIDELIEKGTDALIEAGWSKDDARRAIATRYMDLEKELRRNKKLDLARQLHTKIRALEKAWDLRV